MPKVQASASPRLTGYVKKQGQAKGGKGYRKRKEPFDPIFHDEIITFPHYLNGRSMSFLINHFWHGIQQDKDEEKDGSSQEALVRVGLETHFQKHEGKPDHEAHRDDIPKILAEAGRNVLPGETAGSQHGLFGEMQCGSNDQGI